MVHKKVMKRVGWERGSKTNKQKNGEGEVEQTVRLSGNGLTVRWYLGLSIALR